MSEVILARTLETSDGNHIGHITLNAEATLNSLSLDMIDLIQVALNDWRESPDVIAIFFDAAGEKAFSAGGDIQNLYHDMKATSEGPRSYCEAFFEREYRLDFDLRQYPKPTIAWGHGIVMGGGLGIFSACQHRIVTEKTRMAMPEITIGLFPDAGATHTFKQMDPVWAHFLALTGAQINANDALLVGMADALIEQDRKNDFINALLKRDPSLAFSAQIQQVIRDLEPGASAPDGLLSAHESVIRATFSQALAASEPLTTLVAALEDWPSEPFLDRAKQAFLKGSPTTAAIILEQFERAKALSLAEMFTMELNIAVACSRRGEFEEGVRALLIEKDGNPAWKHRHGEVPDADVQAHFQSHWQTHPLTDLGQASPASTT